MEYGLDIGPGAIRSATDTSTEPAIESEPPIVLPADESMLDAAGLSNDAATTVDWEGTTYVVGSDARTVADATETEPESLFSNGVLGTDDYTPAALALLVEDLCGTSIDDGTEFCYTTPGTVVDAAVPTDTHRETVASTLDDRGYEATPISKGFAVIYDQLADDNYTGLGICFETQTTSVALAYYGVPVLSFSISTGSEWIVEQAAEETGSRPSKVAAIFDEFVLDPDATAGALEHAIADAVDTVVGDLVDAVATQADAGDIQDGLAVPIAVAGDGAVEGIEYLVGGRFDAGVVPFSIRSVRLAPEPSQSAARGALAAAADDVAAFDEVTWGDSTEETSSIAATKPADEVGASIAAADDSDPTSETLTSVSFDGTLESEPDHDRADDAIDLLFDRLATRDEEIQAVGEDIEQLSEKVDYVKQRSPSVEAVQNLETRLEAVATDLTDLEAESETHARTDTVDDLAADIDGLSEAVDELEADVGTVDSAVETLAETTSNAADERTALDDRLTTFATELEAVTDRTDSLDARADTIHDELTELAADTASETDLDAVEERVLRIDDELAALGDDVGRIETRTTGLAGRLEEEMTRTTALSDRLDELSTETDGRLETIEVEAATTDDIERLQESIDSLSTELESLSEATTVIEAQIAENESELQARIDSVRMELDEQLDDVRETIGDVQVTLDEQVDDVRNETDGQIADVRDEVDNVRNEVGEQVTKARHEVDEQIGDVRTDLEARFDDVSAAIGDVDATVEDATDEIDDIAADVDAVRTEYEQLSTQMAELSSHDRDSRLDEHREELDRLVDELDALETAVESAADATNTRDLESAVSRVESEVAELTTAVDSLDDRVGTIDDRLVSMDDRFVTVDDRLETVETWAAESPNRDDELASLRADLETVREESSETTPLPMAGLAGGGSAGVVAGGALALAGTTIVGAVALVVGLALLGAAYTLRE